MPPRFRPIHLCQLVSMALLVLACLAALLLCGCRTSEIMSCRVVVPEGVTSCGPVTIHQTFVARDLDLDIGQGKTVPVRALSDISAAASQSGDAAAELIDESAQDTSTGSAPVPAQSSPSVPSVDNPPSPFNPQLSAFLPHPSLR